MTKQIRLKDKVIIIQACDECPIRFSRSVDYGDDFIDMCGIFYMDEKHDD